MRFRILLFFLLKIKVNFTGWFTASYTPIFQGRLQQDDHHITTIYLDFSLDYIIMILW